MAKHKSAAHTKDASQSSLLLHLLHRGLTKIKNIFAKSVILQFFSSYDRMEACASDSFIVRTCRNLKNQIRKRFAKKPRRELGTEQISPNEVGIFAPATLPRSIKNRIGEAVEESKVLGTAKRLMRNLLYVPMMSYGVFIFSFGLFTTVMQAILYFLLGASEGAALDLFVGLALVLLSLPVIFKGYEPMIEHFGESVIGNLMFRVFQKTKLSKDVKTTKPTFLFFLAGMAVGLLTYFAPPMWILLSMGVLIAALCVLYVPETGVCLILFSFPFFSGIPHVSSLCAAAILYTGICMLLKVIVGRRSMSFGLLDGVVLLFGLIVLSTGMAGGRFANSALLYVVLLSGYFTLSNLLRSPAWIKRSIAALTLSSFMVTATGIVSLFGNFGLQISLLSDPMMTTMYLLAVTPLALVMLVKAERARGRLLYFVIAAADIAYLLLLGSPIGICALCVELLGFFLFYTRKTWTALVILILLLPFVSYVFLPDFSALADQMMLSGRLELNRTLCGVVSQAPLSGIGMSDSALLDAISLETTADLSIGNTWLRMLVQVGIPGLIVFLLFILLWYASGFTMLRKHSVKENCVSMHLALLTSLTGLLIVGNLAYLWSDNRMLLLFWMLAGISRALQRSSKRTEEYASDQSEPERQDGIQSVDIELTAPQLVRKPDMDDMSGGKDEMI